jgi:hypothetical protein
MEIRVLQSRCREANNINFSCEGSRFNPCPEATISENFRGFVQSIHAIAGTVPKIRP